MDEGRKEEVTAEGAKLDIQGIVQTAIQEFIRAQQAKAEPAHKTELAEERKRRERLEQRVNELVEENKRSRAVAEEAERSAAIRAELQRLGVAKVDLAFRAVKEDVYRAEDGRLIAKSSQGEAELREYLQRFVNDNPELLPARMAGGSGVPTTPKAAPVSGGVDLDKIRPGMDPEELERVRQEVARVASQALRGL